MQAQLNGFKVGDEAGADTTGSRFPTMHVATATSLQVTVTVTVNEAPHAGIQISSR